MNSICLSDEEMELLKELVTAGRIEMGSRFLHDFITPELHQKYVKLADDIAAGKKGYETSIIEYFDQFQARALYIAFEHIGKTQDLTIAPYAHMHRIIQIKYANGFNPEYRLSVEDLEALYDVCSKMAEVKEDFPNKHIWDDHSETIMERIKNHLPKE